MRYIHQKMNLIKKLKKFLKENKKITDNYQKYYLNMFNMRKNKIRIENNY